MDRGTLFASLLLSVFLKCKYQVLLGIIWPITKSLRYSRFGSYFSCREIFLGKNVFLGPFSYISTRKKLYIGNDVLIGPRVMILSGNHDYRPLGKKISDQKQGIDSDVYIGDDVWVGAGAIIIGTKISIGTVVGAASVVIRDLPPYTICVGAPCRPVKKRYSDSELYEHLKILGISHYESRRIIDERNEQINLDFN